MFYGKVKGRGYISQEKCGSTYVGNGNGDCGWNNNYLARYNLVFKRNTNDVNGNCCFKTEEELIDHVEGFKISPSVSDKDKLALDKMVVEEHDSVPIKKRYLVSRLKHKFKELKISKAEGDCCGTCGWTISYDEPYLQLEDLQICIHCMKEFYDISKPHLDELDGAYHDTWLMERVTREL